MRPQKLTLAILLIAFCGTTFAQQRFAQPERGFYSVIPAVKWEDALLSGNGTMGTLVIGAPQDETIIVNHAYLYLPDKIPAGYLDQIKRLPRVRQLLFDGKFEEACNEIKIMREECNYNGFDRDPFITGFDLAIGQETGDISRYQRATDFETAENIVEWQSDKGYSVRRSFVSRADSVIAVVFRSDGKINCTLSFEQRNQLNKQGQKIVAPGFSSIKSGVDGDWLWFAARYENENAYNPWIGYEGAGRVVSRGGRQFQAGNKIVVSDADEVTVYLKIEPLYKGQDAIIPRLKQYIDSRQKPYDELLAAHKTVHNALFGKVRLNLNAPAADRALSTDTLISRTRRVPLGSPVALAMIEKEYDAGRYNIICSTGANPPNLQGLWSGTWFAAWCGSMTVNGNLQTAISFLLQGNTPELMHAYFKYNAEHIDGFRRNARELFNCRGINIPAQMTVSPLYTDFYHSAPHNFWTAGAGWAAWQYYDYYRYTGDVDFLKTTAYPFMKEAAAFLEDFLTVEHDGKLVFIPSMSPENAPDTELNCQTRINSTMDVMVTKQLLRACIDAAHILKQDAKLVKIWQGMIAKMPEYEVNDEGYFREWLWDGIGEGHHHRHASHFYALYDERPAEITDNPLFVKGIEKSVDARFAHRKRDGGMAFGMFQLGMAATHLRNVRQASEAINTLARSYWAYGMASYHDPRWTFNMDISGGFPYLVSQALIYTDMNYLELLPCLLPEWKSGSLEGLLLRGNITLQKLTWDENRVEVTLVAQKNCDYTIEYKGPKRKVKLQKNTPVTFKFQ
jgi:hypothetical protein